MEKTSKLTELGPSDQTGTVPANTSDVNGQLPKKDYRQPKLALLGTVRTITATSVC